MAKSYYNNSKISTYGNNNNKNSNPFNNSIKKNNSKIYNSSKSSKIYERHYDRVLV